jgi:hypothetical protein
MRRALLCDGGGSERRRVDGADALEEAIEMSAHELALLLQNRGLTIAKVHEPVLQLVQLSLLVQRFEKRPRLEGGRRQRGTFVGHHFVDVDLQRTQARGRGAGRKGGGAE